MSDRGVLSPKEDPVPADLDAIRARHDRAMAEWQAGSVAGQTVVAMHASALDVPILLAELADTETTLGNAVTEVEEANVRLQTERDRLREDVIPPLRDERDAAVAALDPAVIAAEQAEVQALRAEVVALKRDRKWEANRANEAARLSAAARGRADDLARQIEKLQEKLAAVDDDRTSRDAWAVNLGLRYDLSEDLDPYDAIRRYLQKVILQRNEIMAERAAAHALLVQEQQAHAVTRADADSTLEYLRRHMIAAEAELERQRPVIEAARAWRADSNGVGSWATSRALVVAVDALGTPTPSEEGADPDLMAMQSWDAHERNADVDPA